MLAVVALFVLMASLVVPNLAGSDSRQLRQQAQQVVAQLELARQRSVVTGIPHRLVIDLDGSAYALEWLASDAEAEADAAGEPPPPDAPSELDLYGQPPLDLSAPRREELAFRPMPGLFGRFTRLPEGVFFAGVQTPEGWADRGETFVAFERDGSTENTQVVLEAEDGTSLTLDVQPFADTVRIRDETF